MPLANLNNTLSGPDRTPSSAFFAGAPWPNLKFCTTRRGVEGVDLYHDIYK